MTAIPLALIGIGKIARDQHLPALARSSDFTLVGAVARHPVDIDVPVFATLAELKAAQHAMAAVSICTPPRGRLNLVSDALALGCHVMIEKPPAATLSEAERMVQLAQAADRTLFASWHSREAAGVEVARAWLAERRLRSARVRWLEDVRVWHPGQEWIWEPGIGVFDPGINAFSILTRIVGGSLAVSRAELGFPANRLAPITAALELMDENGAQIDVAFSFDQRGPQQWTMELLTEEGALTLADGGGSVAIDDIPQDIGENAEYPRLYDRFADLIRARRTDADLAPLRLVADSFMCAERREVGAFAWNS